MGIRDKQAIQHETKAKNGESSDSNKVLAIFNGNIIFLVYNIYLSQIFE